MVPLLEMLPLSAAWLTITPTALASPVEVAPTEMVPLLAMPPPTDAPLNTSIPKARAMSLPETAVCTPMLPALEMPPERLLPTPMTPMPTPESEEETLMTPSAPLVICPVMAVAD